MPDPTPAAKRPAPDLADVVARFTAALRAAGLPVGPDRAERFTTAVITADPVTLARLRACAHATLAYAHEHQPILDAVFDAVFGGFTDPADQRGDPTASPAALATRGHSTGPAGTPQPVAGSATATAHGGRSSPDATQVDVPSAASDAERLRHRDFADLTADELLLLSAAMTQLRLATPVRRSRRNRVTAAGHRIDLRATLRRAHRSCGDPIRLARREPRQRARRLVALCDISGSMEPYARAMLQLLYCAAGTPRTEVFTFATRLTRLTPVLARTTPAIALARAGAAAPDWSGGTRIGACLQDFLDRHGRRGMARGAVVVIISDGWETGDPSTLALAMRRLRLLAYKVIWVNPRTRSPRYRPETGGMAAAWPHCDAVVSAHDLAALGDLARAVSEPPTRRGMSP
ncbi:MAG: VWA domain-containing protein [Hamadaea sp.]|nr:VWA domain-containing protein [Hamadaea sp.]